MTRYVSQTHYVDAVRWTGEPQMGDGPVAVPPELEAFAPGQLGMIRTHDDEWWPVINKSGSNVLRPGYWLVRDGRGLLWVFDDESFRASYVVPE